MKSIMMLLYIISTCMTYKFKNNTCGKKLIHRNLRDWRKKIVIDCKRRKDSPKKMWHQNLMLQKIKLFQICDNSKTSEFRKIKVIRNYLILYYEVLLLYYEFLFILHQLLVYISWALKYFWKYFYLMYLVKLLI